MNLNNNYNFRLGDCEIKQEDTILSIVEGRMVPRDLADFEEISGSRENAYFYVDANGKPMKIKVADVASGMIAVVEREPEFANEGQIIFRLIGENKYVIEQFDGKNWKELHVMSEADIVKFTPSESLKSTNVQAAITELDSQVIKLETGSVSKLNDLKVSVNIKSADANIKVIADKSSNSISISAPTLATAAEVGLLSTNLAEHKVDYVNPHKVSKEQVGLGNVDNTSDLIKPISNAQAAVNNALQTNIDKKEDRITLDNKLKRELLQGIADDIIVTKDVGGYSTKDVIPAGTSLFDIIIQLLHPQIPEGEAYLYYYTGTAIPDTIDKYSAEWTKEKCDGTIVNIGATHLYSPQRQYIAFACPKSYGDIKHIYQNDLTMFDLIGDFTVKEVEIDDTEYLMYYVTEKLLGTNDKYDFKWN